MKVKILSLLLSVTLFFFAAVPARAAEAFEDTSFIDLLDYNTVDSNGNFFSLPSSKTIYFNMPSQHTLSYCEILLRSSSNVAPTITVTWGGTSYTLTSVALGDKMFRYYGSVPEGNYRQVQVNFSASSATVITLYHVYVDVYEATVFDEDCYAAIYSSDYYSTIHYVSSDTINGRSWTGVSDYNEAQFDITAYCTDWKKYDYIDISFYMTVSDITSVSAFFGDSVLDVYSSPWENSSLGNVDFYLDVRLDLRYLDRTSDDVPTIMISGLVNVSEYNYISVTRCSGGIYSAIDDPNITWLKRIWNAINSGVDSIVSAIKGDTSFGDSFQDDVQDEINELDQAADVMDSVSRPDIDSIDVSMDQYASAADLAVLTAPVSVFFEIDLFKSILIMSILFATVSFVLFGKR